MSPKEQLAIRNTFPSIEMCVCPVHTDTYSGQSSVNCKLQPTAEGEKGNCSLAIYPLTREKSENKSTLVSPGVVDLR